ncbi:MAG: hypothetical protein AB1564_12595 [Chloroflexota bacterium]
MNKIADSSGRKLLLDFLDNYKGFGSLGHLCIANALAERISFSSDPKERSLLAVKMYSELISALEDLGALCIAIRHREEGLGIVYNYLSYGQSHNPHSPKTSTRKMFELCNVDSRVLVTALNLPALEDVVRSFPAESKTFSQLYSVLNQFLPYAANLYLYKDRQVDVVMRAYNKMKHGFVVVDNAAFINPDVISPSDDACWILLDNSEHQSKGDPIVDLVLVEPKIVGLSLERIKGVYGAVVSLCILIKELIGRGLIHSADDLL